MNSRPKIIRILIRLLSPLARLLGHFYVAFRRPKMTGESYLEIMKLIKPGDILLCRSAGEFTNYFIPGFWTHAAIYAGNELLIEAVSPVVREDLIINFIFRKDFVCVLRPKFCNDEHKQKAIDFARKQVKDRIGYDYDFEPNEKAFYCSELVGQSYIQALDGHSPFTLRKTLGVLTFIPTDFYMAKDKFEIVWVNKDNKIPPR